MGLLGGIMKSVINPMTLAQVAMGPAGWASIAMKAIGTAIAQQVIQQVGQKLGLPAGAINIAQQAFSAASGQQGGGLESLLGRSGAGGFSSPLSIAETIKGLGELYNLSPSQQGKLERNANKLMEQMTKDALEGKSSGEDSPSNLKGGKAESFLVAFAKALGKVMDTKMNKMMDISKQIDQKTTQANKDEKQAVTGELTAELQALGQEVGMISQALANSVKSIGEANSTLARKN